MKTLLDLYLVFLKIGVCSFGGLSMIPVINEEMVAHGWMTLEEVADIIAFAEMTPGPLGINAATFAGMRSAGVWGAVSANLGVMTLALTVCMAASACLARLKGNLYLERFTYGIRPVCIGVMLATCLTMVSNYQTPAGAISPGALVIGVVSLVLLVKGEWSIPKVIGAAALLGLVLGGRG